MTTGSSQYLTSVPELTASPAPTVPATPDAVRITRLVEVDVRTVWPKESADFTPWLLANVQALSDAVGVDLEFSEREHSVGDFSLDLIGSTVGGDSIVIVENQFGSTDHRHLGQIITYAGGTKPAVIVWIAEQFREEHRAALDWLNESTVPGIQFFGIRLAAVRLEGADSLLVAPRFELVCKPNDWEKLAKSRTTGEAEPSGTRMLYRQFWEKFAVEAKKRSWTSATPPAQNWWWLPSGISDVAWGVSFAQFGCRSELYFGGPDPAGNAARFQALRDRSRDIDAAYGPDDLIFDELPNKKACRIEARLHGPKIADQSKWSQVVDWMVDTQQRLRSAIASVGGIPAATVDPAE